MKGGAITKIPRVVDWTVVGLEERTGLGLVDGETRAGLENLSFCLVRVPPIILFFNRVARVSSIPPHPRDTTSVVWVPPIHFTPLSLRLPLLVRAACLLGYPFSLPLFCEIPSRDVSLRTCWQSRPTNYILHRVKRLLLQHDRCFYF